MAVFAGQQRRKQRSAGSTRYGNSTGIEKHGGERDGRATQRPQSSHKGIFHNRSRDEQSSDRSNGLSDASELGMRRRSISDAVQGVEEDKPATDQSYIRLLHSLNTIVPEKHPPTKKRRLEDASTKSGMDVTKEFGEQDVSDDEQEFVSEEMEDDGFQDQDDPFTQHFVKVNGKDLLQEILDIENGKWRIDKRAKDENWGFAIRCPDSVNKEVESSTQSFNLLKDTHIKLRLKSYADAQIPPLKGLLGHLASCIFKYRDVAVPLRNLHNADIFRSLACLHSLNHVFKTRDKILKNNTRLTKEGEDSNLEVQDQGFTRPKVLIILPTRHSCVRYIDTIISLCKPEQQENRKRFQEIFASSVDVLSENKPNDFRDLFAGNDDDMFRLGIKFTRKTLKYFSQFYNSDIIFASPLGLRTVLGVEDPRKEDYDFLSSIEIVIIDQADALMMQNWQNVEYVFERLNLQPKELHGCDISRVRSWYLEGHAKFLRQSLVFSSFSFPLLNKLYNQKMLNTAGQVKYSMIGDGAMVELTVPVRQTFMRFDFNNPSTEPDDRFQFFSSTVLSSLIRESKVGVDNGFGALVYIPSYPDFVRLRNLLTKSAETQDISFGVISEYTSVKEVARARSHFLSGRYSILLYTERAHHFRRYHLKGVKKIVMYGLPENPTFYKEIVGGYLGASLAAAKLKMNEARIRALFSRLDVLKLERIVGSGRFMAMLNDEGGDTFDFL